MANKGIDFVLSLNATKFQSALNAVASKTKAAGAAIGTYWKNTESGARRAGDAFASMQTKVLGAIAAIGGIYAAKATFDSVTGAAMEADKAAFNLGTSIQAANREFKVGSSESWRQNITTLNKELKIYSTQVLEQAASKTVDMTKRLGLSEQQMVKVVRAAANLGAGKFELSDSVERVTAALRGEAEASEALGLSLNENYVKSWYEAKGATQGAWKDLTDIQKAQVRFNILLQQSDPLLGKAAASAGTYGGALTKLQGIYDGIKARVGEVITRNNFFIEAISRVGSIVEGLDTDIGANQQKWMEWSKQSSLAVLQFVVDTAEGLDDVYRSMSGVGGVLKSTYAGALMLGKGFQYLFEQANRATGNADKAAYWANAQVEATRLIDQAIAGANKSFDAAATGSTKLQGVAVKLAAIKQEMASIEAKPIAPDMLVPADKLKANTDRVQQEIIKVGDKYVGLAKQVNSEKITPQIEIEQAAFARSQEMLRAAVENQEKTMEQPIEAYRKNWGEVNEDIVKDSDAAAEEVAASWSDASTEFESKWTQVIRNISLQFDNLLAKADRAESASSGASGSYADGGRVRGWSPHSRADNINAWLTAGEFVQPVSRVRQYGLAFMEAVRSGTFPASLALAGISGRIGSLMAAVPTGQAFATGGMAGASPSEIHALDISLGGAYAGRLTGSPVDVRAITKAFQRAERLRSK